MIALQIKILCAWPVTGTECNILELTGNHLCYNLHSLSKFREYQIKTVWAIGVTNLKYHSSTLSVCVTTLLLTIYHNLIESFLHREKKTLIRYPFKREISLKFYRYHPRNYLYRRRKSIRKLIFVVCCTCNWHLQHACRNLNSTIKI